MKRPALLPLLLASLALASLPACGDGTDDGTGGSDSGGSDSGGSSGGTDSGTGASTSGGGSGGTDGGSGASTSGGGSGGGTIVYGSGTAAVDFNGTTVHFEFFEVADFGGNLGFIAGSDSVDSDTVDSLALYILEPGVGTFGCTDNGIAEISMQAEDSDGETTSFSSHGASSCTITISEWGAVGEPVRGTFSGGVKTFLDEEATLTNGSFDLIRGSDR